MAEKFKAELRGTKELAKLLKKLPEKIRKKSLRAAISKASTPILKDAKRRVTKDSGLLKKALKRQIETKKKSGIVSAKIGPDKTVQGVVTVYKRKDGSEVKANRKPVRYAHLVEKGHGGKSAKPKPFLFPAFEANKAKALSIMTEELRAAIKKAK